MAKILFLAHRAPFPPDKGDKIRAFNILRHLAARHDVWLGALADDPADRRRRDPALEGLRGVCLPPLGRLRRGWNMACGAVSGAPLSVARFRHPALGRWIETTLRDVRPDVVLVFSSALAQYVLGRLDPGVRLILDFVDADAQKWLDYAGATAPPARWLYRMEGRRLRRRSRKALGHRERGGYRVLLSDAWPRDRFGHRLLRAHGLSPQHRRR